MRVYDIFSSVLGTIKVDAERERDDLLIYPQAIPEGSFCLSFFHGMITVGAFQMAPIVQYETPVH
jgi:hypothetical protein